MFIVNYGDFIEEIKFVFLVLYFNIWDISVGKMGLLLDIVQFELFICNDLMYVCLFFYCDDIEGYEGEIVYVL